MYSEHIFRFTSLLACKALCYSGYKQVVGHSKSSNESASKTLDYINMYYYPYRM